MRIATLDIGGTSIKSGIWTGGRQAQEVREHDTNAGRGGAYVMERAKEILHAYGDFDAVGISTAGQVNSRDGVIRYANENIPGYTGMKIRELMEKEFGVPTAVENDVNAAAVGEGRFGAGRDFSDYLCITYGTGVGGAIVIDHKIYTGSNFSAGEFGAMPVHPEDCREGDPFSGCYEKYASATGLVLKAVEYDASLDNGRKIFERLQEPKVKEIVDSWTDEIVLGLRSLIHIFNPSCVILGGGIMAQPYILDQVKKKTLGTIMSSFHDVKLVQAELGNQAGLLGAAYLADERRKKVFL